MSTGGGGITTVTFGSTRVEVLATILSLIPFEIINGFAGMYSTSPIRMPLMRPAAEDVVQRIAIIRLFDVLRCLLQLKLC